MAEWETKLVDRNLGNAEEMLAVDHTNKLASTL
jgi:hypothetical protein